MKNKKIFLILLFFSMLLITGCSGSVQLHQRMMVQGIGVDLNASGGYTITMQALDFKNPEGENEPSVKVLELTGKTLLETLNSASKQSGLIPMYSQNLVVVIGHDAAARGMSQFMDFFIRHYEARPNVKICVAETKASEILALEADKGVMQAKDISDLIPNEVHSDILHFVRNLKDSSSDPSCLYLGIKETDEKKSVEVKGLALFTGDKLSGLALDTEYLAILATMGVGNLGIYNVYVDNLGIVSLELSKVKSQIDPNIGETEKQFTIDISIGASVLEVTPHNGVRIGEQEQLDIERQLNYDIEKICKQAIDKLVKLNSDVLRFGKILMNSRPSYFREISADWKKVMETFSYKISVKSELAITGTEI